MENQKTTIGVIGSGTMGAGIALVALQGGAQVVLQDTFPSMLEKGRVYLEKFLEKKGLGDLIKNLHLTENLSELSACNVVIEAAPEQLGLKQELFKQLESICSPDTILATNTSTLSVTAIAAAVERPERMAGMHFFNPAPVLPLVEIVRGARTSQATVEALVDLSKALGKTPVVTGDTPGFIVNRVARPYYGEALRLLGEGTATFEEIDLLAEQGAGFRMGPFKLMDLIGIDINAGAMRSMYEQTYGEPRYRPHAIQMQKLAEGALGRKTGRGFYEYKEGEAKAKEEGLKEFRDSRTGGGAVLISKGSWAPGVAAACEQAGYNATVESKGLQAVAGFVSAGWSETVMDHLSDFDSSLTPEAPLFVQCADIALSEAKKWVHHPERLVGFDGLFFEGAAVTLVGGEAVRERAEAVMLALGKTPVWANESPALVLPRIVCQLVNEAAFAELEGVASGETIDLAMRLGVNYPRGPLEWGRKLGFERVLAVLDHLYAEYHEERYRACVLLRKFARASV
jgi:3-hydroxybutyryl-CoA dehydrogenase